MTPPLGASPHEQALAAAVHEHDREEAAMRGELAQPNANANSD
jgi:hypothetical protein